MYYMIYLTSHWRHQLHKVLQNWYQVGHRHELNRGAPMGWSAQIMGGGFRRGQNSEAVTRLTVQPSSQCEINMVKARCHPPFIDLTGRKRFTHLFRESSLRLLEDFTPLPYSHFPPWLVQWFCDQIAGYRVQSHNDSFLIYRLVVLYTHPLFLITDKTDSFNTGTPFLKLVHPVTKCRLGNDNQMWWWYVTMMLHITKQWYRL